MTSAIFETTNGLFQFESVKKEGLFACHLGAIPTVAVFRADTVGQLMNSSTGNSKKSSVKTTQTSKGDQFRFLRPWIGRGLIISEGEHWRRHRKLISPAFSPAILRSFLPSFNSNVEIMLSRVSNSKSKVFDLRFLVKDLALDIVTETTLGKAVGAQQVATNRAEYIEPLDEALTCFAHRLMNPLHHLDLLYRLSGEGRKNTRVIRKVHRYVKKIVEERKSGKGEFVDPQSTMSTTVKKRLPCFLDLLLKATQERPTEITERDILEEVNALMFAGQDSTSVAMTMALALVAGDQRVQGLIIKELAEEVFAEEADPVRCPITGEHCRRMRYLEAVVKEALRLYTPAPNTAKKVVEKEGVMVGGHRIPQGTSVLILYSLMHRDPVVFPQPDRFIPERFLEPENFSFLDSAFAHFPRPVPLGAFIPFSTGPRVCLGLRYALLEMKAVLAGVLRRYHLKAVTPRDSIRFGVAVVLTIRSPVMVRFEERKVENFFANKKCS